MSIDIAQTLALIGTGTDAVTSLMNFVKTARSDKGPDLEAITAAQEKVLQLQQTLFSAQKSLFELQDDNMKLRSENGKLKKRDLQLENYKLTSIGTGPAAFVYIEKDVVENAEGQPYYCQPCLDDGNRAVLQLENRDLGFDLLKCPRCKSGIRVSNGRKAAGFTVMTTGRSRWSDGMDGF